MKIVFSDREIEAEPAESETILDLLRRLGIYLSSPCGGQGTCGKCRVRFREYVPAATAGELELLTEEERKEGIRLACRHSAERTGEIEILPEKLQPIERKTVFSGEEQSQGSYGIAVDLGTTTIEAALWDFGGEREAARCTLPNPEQIYGADVITRQTYALQSEENRKNLQEKLIEGINRAVEQLCVEGRTVPENICRMVLAGNTTISHFLLNLDVKGISKSPFVPAFTGGVRMNAGELGIRAGKDCEVYVPPNLGGHVGGDIAAGLVKYGICCRGEKLLYIDIGTNTEIVLSDGKRIVACSAAAGPAFEGSSLSCGMAALPGAIVQVKLKEGVRFETLGGEKPLGICGSGILEAVSELCRERVVDSSGRILGREEFLRGYGSRSIGEQIVAEGEANAFILSSAEGIGISQKDVREFQLAKAAVRSGIEVLLRELRLEAGELQHICLAGAFGTHLSMESAVRTGLLPRFPEEGLRIVGNGALAGAVLLLDHEEERFAAEEIADRTEYIALSDREDFMETYLGAMNF